MKHIISIITLLLLFLVSCEGGDKETAEPIKPKDEYTKENPGEWKAVAPAHAPIVELMGKSGDNNIKVIIPGTEFDSSHYIEKVGILDKDQHEILSKPLEKGMHEATLTMKYDPDSLADMKVFIRCNLHDVWTVTMDKAVIIKK